MNNKRVNAVVYVATFLAAGFGVENTYPFVVALMMAGINQGMNTLVMTGLAMLGIAFTFNVTTLVKYGVIVIAIIIFTKAFLDEQMRKNTVILAVYAGVVTVVTQIIVMIFNDASGNAMMLLVLESVTAVAFTFVFSESFKTFKDNISITYMKNKNIVAVAALIMTALSGVPENILGIMALLTIAVYISTMVGHKYGVTYGVFIGSISGIIAVLAYGEYGYALLLVIIGCISGVIRDIGKIQVAISVIGIAYLMGETVLEGIIEPWFIYQ